MGLSGGYLADARPGGVGDCSARAASRVRATTIRDALFRSILVFSQS
jgi:hypothetical protein